MLETKRPLNFRDIGGLPTTGGGQVRSGVLYRSEGPKNFTGPHLEHIGALGIRAIFDLRSDGERERDPHDWHSADCRWIAMDMNTDLRAADATEWERLRVDPDPALSRHVMAQNYAAMPGALLPHWRVMVETLLDGAVPAIINCTAGKDRTGAAVGLLLKMLGVEQDDILADYLKSDIFGQNMVLQGSIEQGFMESFGFMPNQAAVDALIGVDADYLRASLAIVETQWGGIAGFCEAAGVGAAMQRDLRAMLTTDEI